MNGLYRLFLKITPIIMLICFICFGITHTFQAEGTNLTYLQTEYIDRTTYEEIENPTEQQKADSLKLYTLDTQSYMQNINVNILKRSVTNVIDLDKYNQTLNTFNLIWSDGYQFLDGIQTIINAIILAINTIIIPINIIITPLRITAGILLTALTISGININNNTPILNLLNTILDQTAIPMLRPTYNAEYNTEIESNTYKFDNTIIPNAEDTPSIRIYVNFTGTDQTTFNGLIWNYNGTGDIYYLYLENNQYNEIQVYTNTNNTGWIYNNCQQITITDTSMTNEYDKATLVVILQHYATQIQ